METILHDFNQNVTTLVEEFLENAIETLQFTADKKMIHKMGININYLSLRNYT